MPSCSSTTKSCGSTCRISRPLGSATAFAASIARRTSSRVISRFLPATATTPRLLNALTCVPDSPRWTESISTPAGQLRLVDRLLDRLDRRLEVDDHAPPDPARVRQPHPDDVEPAVVGHLADDGGDLGRADVQAHQVRSLRATDPPSERCARLPAACRPRPCRPRRAASRTRDRRTADRRSRCPAPARGAPTRPRDTTAGARRTARRRGAAAPDRRRAARRRRAGR